MSTTRRPTTTRKTLAQKERDKILRLETQPVVHEMFEQALVYTQNDEFWYVKFLLASRGRLPKNFFVRRNTVCFKNPKNQIYSEDLGRSPLEVYETFKRFLRLHGRFDSEKDILADELASQMSDAKKSAPKGVVDVEIYDYLCRFKEEEAESNPNFSEEKYAEYKRLVFIVIRLMGKKCVEYEDGRIVSVNGIFEDENGNYYADPKLFEVKEKKPKRHQEKAFGSFYKSKEEDFEEVVKALAKSRKDLSLNEVVNLKNLTTT